MEEPMKKLLLLSLLSVASGIHAMEPVEPAESQSEDTLATSLFKIAVSKTLTTNKKETLTSLNALLKETKNNPAQEPTFIKEQLKTDFEGTKITDLQKYENLHELYSKPRETRNFTQTFIHSKNGHSFTIDKPQSESDFETIKLIFRDQHSNADALYFPFRILCQAAGYFLKPNGIARMFIEDIKDQKYECFILRDNTNTRVIGFVTYRPEVNKTYICDICVDENYRGHGFGKRLIDAVIAQEKQHDVKKIYLHSDPKPVEFYKHIGMIQTGTVYFGIGSQPIFEKNI